MSRPTFRNADKFQVLPHREWIRQHMPSGSQGYIVEDLDLVLRVYGEEFGTDAVGQFILVELKYGRSRIGLAQRKTFGLLDRLLRAADPGRERYLGYYIVNYTHEDWDQADFRINSLDVTHQQFLDFLRLQIDGIPPVF